MLGSVMLLEQKERRQDVLTETYCIYPAIRQGFCPSRMTSNN